MAQSTAVPLPGEQHTGRSARGLSWARVGATTMAWGPLVAVVALALWLNAWNLARAGYGNTYYAAAVRSMTMSWKNFFFGALDPGGFITVDKPPVFPWIDAISARVFGYSSWSLLLPSALAGAGTVALLWLIVRRWCGMAAATIAAVVLALTPITVAVDRLNLPEPFYIFALVAAAGCLLRSLEARRWLLWAAAAGALVGIAFNTKMLAAWIPGPALALALVVGIRGSWRTAWKGVAARLAMLAAVTFAVSASWLLVVDAWPASHRPYVGGSTDNTVANLVLGYNGVDRVAGDTQGGGGRLQPPPNTRPNSSSNAPRPNAPAPNRGGTAPRVRPGGGGGATGAGGVIAGRPGWLRMFDAANGGQIAWFLLFALLGGLLLLWQGWRDSSRRAFAVLWLGWVVLFAGVFSYTQGIYHSYYTSALAPGIAALVGAGAMSAAALVRRHWAWLIVPAAMVAVTVWVQLQIAGTEPNFYEWVRPFTVIVALAGLALLVLSVFRRLPAAAGIAVAVTGLLLLPGAWSLHETAYASMNATLPQAGPRAGVAAGTFGSQAFDSGTTSLASWLQAHHDPNARWDLAVTNAQNASTLIAQDKLSVMALGGFMGSDPAITAAGFADLVAKGDVRYVLAGNARGGRGIPQGFGGAFGNPFGGAGASGSGAGAQPRNGVPGFGPFPQPASAVPGARPSTQPPPAQQSFGGGSSATIVMSVVQSACTPVSDPSLPAQYRNAIYDCAGKAEALRAIAP